MEVSLDPAGRRGHVLAMVLCAPAFHERHSEKNGMLCFGVCCTIDYLILSNYIHSGNKVVAGRTKNVARTATMTEDCYFYQKYR